MENNKVVKFELKKILKNRKLSYEAFGKMCYPEMDKSHVSRLANGNMIPLGSLERIVNALNLEPHEIAELIKVYE